MSASQIRKYCAMGAEIWGRLDGFTKGLVSSSCVLLLGLSLTALSAIPVGGDSDCLCHRNRGGPCFTSQYKTNLTVTASFADMTSNYTIRTPDTRLPFHEYQITYMPVQGTGTVVLTYEGDVTTWSYTAASGFGVYTSLFTSNGVLIQSEEANGYYLEVSQCLFGGCSEVTEQYSFPATVGTNFFLGIRQFVTYQSDCPESTNNNAREGYETYPTNWNFEFTQP